jgi:hypothetical protein
MRWKDWALSIFSVKGCRRQRTRSTRDIVNNSAILDVAIAN